MARFKLQNQMWRQFGDIGSINKVMDLKTGSLWKDRKYNASFSYFVVSMLYRYKKYFSLSLF